MIIHLLTSFILFIELALSNKQVQLSQRLLAVAKKSHSGAEVSLVEGLISWEKGHQDISLALVLDVMYNDSQDVILSATAFRYVFNLKQF